MPTLKISIVIPVFNESLRLPPYLSSICDYIRSKDDFEYEVIVVNDGSGDDLLKSIKTYLDANPFIRLVSLERNMGKGFAVKTGLSYSVGDYILFTDADGATQIEELDKFKKFMCDGYSGMMIGKRNIKEEDDHLLTLITRRLARYLYKDLRKILFLRDIDDTQCGFKIFSKDLKNYFIALQRQYRYSFDIELLSITKLVKKDVKEVDINWTYKPGSKINIIRDSLKMFYDLFKMKVDFIIGRYRLNDVEPLKRVELSKIHNLATEEINKN